MGSQSLSILRQGMWASLTGGWYYDPRQSHFANVFHLYVWLLLLCLPLSVHMVIHSQSQAYANQIKVSSCFFLWFSYCCLIFLLFFVIKLTNLYLHNLFDSGECVTEDQEEGEAEEREDEEGEEDVLNNRTEERGSLKLDLETTKETSTTSPKTEEIEMREIGLKKNTSRERLDEESNDIDNYFRKVSFGGSQGAASPSTAPSVGINLNPSVIDLEVDVHHRNSSGSSIAACGSVSSASLGSGRLTAPTNTMTAGSSFQCKTSPDVASQSPSPPEKPPQDMLQADLWPEPPDFTACEDLSQIGLSESDTMINNNSVMSEGRTKGDNGQDEVGTSLTALSLGNESSQELVTTQSKTSSEALLKGGASFSELGFMAQDPGLVRTLASGAATGGGHHQENQFPTFKGTGRHSDFMGRRARSELETTNYASGDKSHGQQASSSIPPSHPVSLEVIGSAGCSESGDGPRSSSKSAPKSCRFSSIEILPHHRYVPSMASTKSASLIHESIKPIDEMSSDEHQAQAEAAQSHSTLPASFEQRQADEEKGAVGGEAKVLDYPVKSSLKAVTPSTDDEGHESDVSLVVNLSSKGRKKKSTPKLVRSRMTYKGKKHLTANLSSSKFTTSKIPSTSNIMGSSFSGNEESTSSSDETWTSKSRDSVSMSSDSERSDSEQTPLTSSLTETAGPSTGKSLAGSRYPDTPAYGGLASGSGASDTKDDKMKKIIYDILSKKDLTEFELELKRLKAEFDSKRRRRHRSTRRLQEQEQPRGPTTSSDKRRDSGKGSPSKEPVYQQLSGEAEGGSSPPPAPSAATDGPPAYLLARILSTPGTHLAHTHDDTTTGAVHCFQDERGNWLTYTFDENSLGVARGLMNGEQKAPFEVYAANVSAGKWDSSSSSSESAVVFESPANVLHTPRQHLPPPPPRRPSGSNTFGNDDNLSNHTLARYLAGNPNSNDPCLFADAFPITAFSPNRPQRRLEIPPNVLLGHPSGSFSGLLNNNNLSDLTNLSFPGLRFSDFASPSDLPPPKPKQYYKLWLPPCLQWKYIKVRFDRLHLLALLDRSLTTVELITSILLAVTVAVLGSTVLESNIFKDLWLFLFCFVIASCQYTLLKSVQPDAASPTHGYNRTIIYSRPIYFSFGCSIILLCQLFLSKPEETQKQLSFKVYGLDLMSPFIVETILEAGKVFVLAFPIIFSLGLLPQINTFFMYLFEQIDIHVLGGTAATMGLTSAVYAISRSVVVISLLYCLGLISLWRVFNASLASQSDFTFHDYDVLFSVFCGILVSSAYHLSRSSSDPTVLWKLIKKCFICKKVRVKNLGKKSVEEGAGEEVEMTERSVEEEDAADDGDVTVLSFDQEYVDPLPKKLAKTLTIRLQNDLITCVVLTVVVFAINVSTIFTLQPYVESSLRLVAIVWGFILHYFLNHFRKELPWLCFAHPILKPREYDLFEVKDAAKLMWFERIQAWLWMIEKNVIYPLLFLSAITKDTPLIMAQFGFYAGIVIVVICGFKCIRSSFNDSSHNHLILLFTYLFFEFDLYHIREPFLINYFLAAIVYQKFYELLLKVRFVVTYVAPWQITWGSAFHAFAQPFSVPHSAMLLVQAFLSSILSSPLQPVLGSAIFLTSYVRPIKFWERDYNTKRVDNSNTRLAAQLDRNQLGTDDNNLNSIFYEHLTRSLQHSLYGDLALGRWGQVSQGDCFVLASDNLNCLVHVIELGNGLVTFQVRGLEFRGTYCQQREVEAITEGVSEDEGCCCCEPGHLPRMLSINAAFNQRWLAWEVTHTKYVLEGYSITDNSAVSMLQPYDLRKALITYYVKSVIFYTISNPRLSKWLTNEVILREALDPLTSDKNFVDVDTTFNSSVDEDYDCRTNGITRVSFSLIYLQWIKHCLNEEEEKKKRRRRKRRLSSQVSVEPTEAETEAYQEKVVSICMALSLLARRALSAASHHNSFTSVEFLLYGLHALFKGDFRITSPRDEWVFQDIELLKQVIAPSVRMAVKLHQDHFTSTDEYEDSKVLHAAITNYQLNLVISHEGDPIWRNAVLSNVPSLLALRHVFDDGTDQYKIIMLNKRYLSFRVIKVNRECVRGLWAGQQQELVYLRNRNPERGSIQNAKQALRNIINSSCDQPIGYPIYVSPLTTSFSETSAHLSSVIGRPFSFAMFRSAALSFWHRIRTRCGEGCSSGGPGGGISADDDLFPGLGSSGMSVATCRRHRHDVYAFERNLGVRGSRDSHSSDRSSEFDSSQLLNRRTRAGHPGLACAQQRPYPSSLSKSQRRRHRENSTSSNLVNLTAFRPNESQQPSASHSTDIEFGSVICRPGRAGLPSIPSLTQRKQQQAATVPVTASVNSSSGSLCHNIQLRSSSSKGDLV